MNATRKRQCEFPGCGRKHEAKGLCQGHYVQKRKGQQLRPLHRYMRGSSIVEKLAAYSENESGCRVWTACINEAGYGQVDWEGRLWQAHRAAYALEHGDIPGDKVVNHICGNPPCINVEHLELVTRQQNNEYRTRMRSDNSTGYRGVYFFKRTGRFRAEVGANGASHHLGYFDSAEEADEAARKGRAALHSMPEFTASVYRTR